MSQLTFFAEEPPASLSASQDYEQDFQTRVATSCLPLVPLLQSIAPSGWFGRTSPASCPVTEDGILVPSSGSWANSGMGSPTEFSTLNTLEYPSDAAVCSLSDVMETGEVPQRYFLSATACRGILRRAEKRGKELPAPLALALRAVADSEPTLKSGGGLVPTLTSNGDAHSGFRDEHGLVVGTYCVATGQGGAEIGAEIGADMAPTLNCNHEAPYIAHSLRDEGFDASEDGTGRGTPLVPVVSPTLDQRAGRSGANSFATSGGLVPVAVALRGRDGGATAELGDDQAFALRASSGGGDKPHVMQSYRVRRLTPMECERLQGFPDGHTAVPHRKKPAADGPRYKAVGNSWAIPNIRWIGRRIDQVNAIRLAA